MKTKFYIYILLISAFAFSSCEKVIDVNLNDADPRVVIEGKLTTEEGNNYISISKTSNFYSDELPVSITGAEVEVSDLDGNVFIFDEVYSGIYRNNTFTAKSYNKYKLHISSDNKTYESTSETFYPVKIDSIAIEENNFGPKGGNKDDELHYKVTCYFTDKLNEDNFYRLRIFINGEFVSGFFCINDNFFDGKTIPYAFGNISLEDGDVVMVELLGIDEANYDYFYMLQQLVNDGENITPGNPPSNIIGDAIGVFGASSLDRMNKVFNIEE